MDNYNNTSHCLSLAAENSSLRFLTLAVKRSDWKIIPIGQPRISGYSDRIGGTVRGRQEEGTEKKATYRDKKRKKDNLPYQEEI